MSREDDPSMRAPRAAGVPRAGDQGVGTGHSADVRTFLIADVRGYTKYTQEHGDEAAAELASTFAELVREVVEVQQGLLLELRGDEALVVFTSARQALRAAVELQERFTQAALPRQVGIGLDSGEAVPVEQGYRGGALNLAARLCSAAKPGQILASEAVIHLAAKVEGLAYVDPRTFKLKGYAEPVRALEVVPAERARRYTLRRKLGRRTRRILSRRGSKVGEVLGRSTAVLREGGRLVSVAEEPPAAASEKAEATYFVVEPSREQLIELARLVDEGAVRPAIDSVFPLAEARAAFERVMMRGKRGKVVLQVGDD